MESYMKIINPIIASLFLCIVLSGCNNRIEEKQTDENTILFKGLTYKVIEIEGQKWLDRNLGASKACEDYKGDEDCWGDLYQWGRMADGHEKRYSETTYEVEDSITPNHSKFVILENTNSDIVKNTQKMLNANWTRVFNKKLWQADTKVNNVCPLGWRIPTIQEYKKLNLKTPEDAFSKLKLSLSGQRGAIKRWSTSNGGAEDMGYMGAYWSSSILEKQSFTLIEVLMLDPYDVYIGPFMRIDGFSVRCIKE